MTDDDHCIWDFKESYASDYAEGTKFIQLVLAKLHEGRWQEWDMFAVHTALIEAVTNAIKHGNKGDGRKRFHVECALFSDRIKLVIADDGAGFDHKNVPDPLLPQYIERPSGRGIFLMQNVMTHVEYSTLGNCVTMEKTMSAEPRAFVFQ